MMMIIIIIDAQYKIFEIEMLIFANQIVMIGHKKENLQLACYLRSNLNITRMSLL